MPGIVIPHSPLSKTMGNSSSQQNRSRLSGGSNKGTPTGGGSGSRSTTPSGSGGKKKPSTPSPSTKSRSNTTPRTTTPILTTNNYSNNYTMMIKSTGSNISTGSNSKAEAWDKFKNMIARYARTNDRRMMIRALKDCARLRVIPMELIESYPSSAQEWKMCEVEVMKTLVKINGTPIGRLSGIHNGSSNPASTPSSSTRNNHNKKGGASSSNGKNKNNKGNNTKSNNTDQSELLIVLKRLCEEMTKTADDDKKNTTATTIISGSTTMISSKGLYHEILLRLQRTTASADAYFQLNALLGCTDLVVQPPKKSPPIQTDLTLYKSNDITQHIHCVSITRHPYGLFRKSDLAGGGASPSMMSHHSGGGSGKRPWIRLIAEVHERVNLSTGDSVRYGSVKIQDKL